MGIFDSFKTTTSPKFNVQQAIMTVIIAAVKADGEVSDQEVARLRAICGLSPIFAGNTNEQDLAVISFASNITTQLKEEAVKIALDTISPELKETAFVFAADMVLADGLLGDAEEEFLSDLANKAGINDDLGRSIIMMTLIRNRGE